MNNLLNQKVTVTGNEGTISGILYDITENRKTAWVKTDEDIFIVDHVTFIEKVEEKKEKEDPIFKALDIEGYDYSLFTHDDEMLIHIDGDKYSITIVTDKGKYKCETTHKRRYELEEAELYGDVRRADGNKRTIKNLQSIMKYVDKFYYKA